MSASDTSRRDFLKTLGLGAAVGAAAVAAAPVLAATAQAAPAAPSAAVMPKRMLGKTGVEVPILCLGGMFDTINNQLLLRQALNWGVSYWDTAEYYGRGLSEEGFGRFFARNPDRRKDVFLVTKLTPKEGNFPERFEKSLARLQTSYVDLFFVHGIDSMSQLKPEFRAFAAEMKKAGKIKHFGFSTHSNMEDLMQAAAKEGGPAANLDVIMATYNTSVMHKPAMQAAVDACAKAGIGLVAMKTQGMGPATAPTEAEAKVAQQFLSRGFTDKQARLKAVWENKTFASICSQMPSINILSANVAAARDQVSLSAAERAALVELASAEATGYCGGCGSICSQACDGLPVQHVMRSLMYHNEYQEPGLGRATFAELPEAVRQRLAQADFAKAEARCPHKLEIAKLVRGAVETLA
ncbi:MAG TPA: aldo/keto reductase [Humidesulfovibrio sp.]|uniref:aldo/keto reductase n=1 Tax=Humidesulfovibrio sp. TaxID=2910988 RepID=UPI002C3059FE|nr:aldo/keto reductase [Humidesulfovibrio sp.]HWR02697.1 aldo/keto reductase [Humidesulfovibrio sp.]